MSKYSNELKLEIVKYCIEKYHSSTEAAKHFNVDVSQVKIWIRKYREHGIKGLIRQQKQIYTGEFRVNVVKYMHNNHLSLKETSVKFNLGCSAVIAKWERIYYEKGPQALYEEHRGRKKNMSSKQSKTKKDINNTENLLEEIQHLRMENEYLKKLNALVQERIKRENEKK